MILRDYQEHAVREALKHQGFLLAAEMRTGKTLIAIEIVRRYAPQSLLIVCPKIAINAVWKPAIESLGDLVPEVYVENYEAISTRSMRRWWQRRPPEFIIADESHMIKNPSSLRSRALRGIARRGATYCLALTGTPLEGGIEDAWAQFDLIDPSVFGSWADFKERYIIYGGYKQHEIIGYRNRDEFTSKFNSRMFRVLLEEVKEEPTKIRKVRIRFPLGKESRRIYDGMLNDFVVNLNSGPIVAPRVITQVMKLHQITGGHIKDGFGIDHFVGNEKIGALRELLKRLSPPMVIFVRFLWELEVIARLVQDVMCWTVTKVSGDNPFTGFDTDVLVIQIRSGLAIDLSRAETAIFYSFDHSYLTYEQSLFRIRSYTSNRVSYYFLLAENTIDEDIYEAIQGKRSLSSVICDKYRKGIYNGSEP